MMKCCTITGKALCLHFYAFVFYMFNVIEMKSLKVAKIISMQQQIYSCIIFIVVFTVFSVIILCTVNH